jgi:hypothetical protein
MYLRFVSASAHDPFSIVTNTYAGTGFFELKVLQQLDTIRIFGIVLQAAFSSSSQPFWKRPRRVRTRNRIDWDIVRIRELHFWMSIILLSRTKALRRNSKRNLRFTCISGATPSDKPPTVLIVPERLRCARRRIRVR